MDQGCSEWRREAWVVSTRVLGGGKHPQAKGGLDPGGKCSQ